MPKRRKRYKSGTARDTREKQRRVVTRVGQGVVFVITLASSVISFTQFGISWRAVIISAFCLLLLLSLLANAISWVDSRYDRSSVRHIAFLTPSSGDQSFYSSMLNSLVRNATLALGQNYIVVPAMPTQSFETVSIWALFASLEDRQVDIDGIIFIPDDPDSHFDELVGFHEERGDIPLVLVDVFFDLASCDIRTRERLPSFVGGDEQLGGALAAGIVMGAVGSPPHAPVALVVNGATTPWEQQRAVSFRENLSVAWPAVTFLETPPIRYSRTAAFEAVVGLLKSVADVKKEILVHAIFACNDDMAIGARGAISRLVREGYNFVEAPQIVGYDGIPEIREYLSVGDRYIAGTVDVRIDEQAKTAMLLMHKLLRSRKRTGELQLIAPSVVLRS